MTTLLMIDDEELFLKSMARYFERRGYRVVAASSAGQALEQFRLAPTAFDAVLLDHDLPDLSGRECLLRLLAVRPHLPVIIMSGYPPECLQQGDYALARAILPKPSDLADVESALRACLPSPPETP